jgi:hypothetical protein
MNQPSCACGARTKYTGRVSRTDDTVIGEMRCPNGHDPLWVFSPTSLDRAFGFEDLGVD